MNNLSLIFLVALALAAVGVLFVTNYSSNFLIGTPQVLLKREEVRGSAVIYKKKPYTLNYDQQNQMIQFINQSVLAKDATVNNRVLDFQKIEIYRFDNKPNLIILPIGYDQKENLIYLIDQIQLRDTSNGKFKQFVLDTYDH